MLFPKALSLFEQFKKRKINLKIVSKNTCGSPPINQVFLSIFQDLTEYFTSDLTVV